MFPRLASFLILGCAAAAPSLPTPLPPQLPSDQLKGRLPGARTKCWYWAPPTCPACPSPSSPPCLNRCCSDWSLEARADRHEDLSGLQCDFMRRYRHAMRRAWPPTASTPPLRRLRPDWTCLRRTPGRAPACDLADERRPPSVVGSQHCSWQRVNAARRRCSGCACLRPSAKAVMD